VAVFVPTRLMEGVKKRARLPERDGTGD
jgi:hypothetical protein